MRPGDPGTRRHVAEYGSRLVCVRYRYDAERRVRVTTVEIEVDRGSWSGRGALEPWSQVAVRLRYEEEELRKGIREAGGRWDPREKLWWLRWDVTCRLGLNERVVAWRDS